MADLSHHDHHHGAPSWIPFFTGAIAVMALLFGYLAWRTAYEGWGLLRLADLPGFGQLEPKPL